MRLPLTALLLAAAALTGCADMGETRDGVNIKSSGHTGSAWDNR